MSHFEVLGIRTSAFGFWENTIQPIQVPTSASWLIFSEVLFFFDVTPPSTDVSENNHSCFLRSTAQSVTTSSIASSIPTPYKQVHFSPISKTNCNNKSFPWNSCPTLALFLYSFFIAYISSLYLFVVFCSVNSLQSGFLPHHFTETALAKNSGWLHFC